jgi:glycosyltransferase involved in cell wall biosynthesis
VRIAIDAHAVGSRLTGNERYIHNLAQQLLEVDHQNDYFLLFSQRQARARWVNGHANMHTRLVSANPIWRLGVDIPRYLHKIHPHVFHYQYTGPLMPTGPEVVTIHDVSFEEYPEFFDPLMRLRLRLTVRRAVKTARRIITVSHFSKDAIVDLLRVSARKVKVIPNGVGPEFRPIHDEAAIQSCLDRYGIRRPYFLAVGDICRRKNQLALVQGFAQWAKRRRSNEHQLILVGKEGGEGEAVLAEAARQGLGDGRVLLTGYAAEEDLPCLYAGAELLINASLYEGFGLPLIEAMACGVPVIASRASCFPEVAADAARYMDPENPTALPTPSRKFSKTTPCGRSWFKRVSNGPSLFRWETRARDAASVSRSCGRGRGALGAREAMAGLPERRQLRSTPSSLPACCCNRSPANPTSSCAYCCWAPAASSPPTCWPH